jgi:hypothetical protein
MFEMLMLRLTTNVTVSPASSARSSLAHVLDRLRARLGEQGGQLVLRQCGALPSPRDRRRHEIAADRPLLAPPRAAPRDERPEAQLHHVEHALLHPLRLHVLRVDAEALRERVAARLELLAHPVHGRERVLGRDVVAVGRQPAEVGGALIDERQPPVGQVGRDLDPHVGQQPLALAHEQTHVVERDRRGPTRQRRRLAVDVGALCLVGDLGRLGAVVARVRHEVLEDHLLEVAVLAVHLRERL